MSQTKLNSRLGPTVLAVLTLAAFAAAITVVPAFAGFAAGSFKAMLGVLGLVLVDVWVLRRSNTYDEIIVHRNVAYALTLLAYAIIIAASVATAQPAAKAHAPLYDRLGSPVETTGIAHLDTALVYVGVQESRPNRGTEVDRFIRVGVRMNPPIPWCAAFTSYALRQAGADVLDRRGVSVLSAVATRHITHRSVDAREVLRGSARPGPGWLIVFRRGATWQGHIEFVVRDDRWRERGDAWYLRCGQTVGGNTSSGDAGSQRDGDGVWRRTRCISPGAYFRPVAFTPVTYR